MCRANLHQRSWARPACVVIIWFLGGKEKKKNQRRSLSAARVCVLRRVIVWFLCAGRPVVGLLACRRGACVLCISERVCARI